MSNPDTIDMVTFFLKQEQYDGLYSERCGCACEIVDLAPCGEILMGCTAGYRYWCEDVDCEHTAGNGQHWHMREKK